jgi:hypothetical protein
VRELKAQKRNTTLEWFVEVDAVTNFSAIFEVSMFTLGLAENVSQL